MKLQTVFLRVARLCIMSWLNEANRFYFSTGTRTLVAGMGITCAAMYEVRRKCNSTLCFFVVVFLHCPAKKGNVLVTQNLSIKSSSSCLAMSIPLSLSGLPPTSVSLTLFFPYF